MKRIISLIIVLVLCVSLCCCSGNDNEAQKITVSHCQGEWSWPILDEIADAFTKETGIEVEYLYVAADTYDQWRDAQFVAGNEPDIIWGMTDAGTYYSNGKIMPLTKYYNEVSPFSGKVWKDDYIDGILENCYDDSGEELIMNLFASVKFNMYYNKDIFAELNLEVPENWSEFVEVCKVIKDAGYIPVSCMNGQSFTFNTLEQPILEDCYANSGKAERLDVITENGYIDENEVLLGLKSGVLKMTDPEFVTYFRIIKDLVPYYNVDFNSVGWEYEALFNEGKAAITFNGSWYPNQHMVNNSNVNYGVALFPYVDNAVFENSRNQVVRYQPSAPTGEICISKKAEKEGRADAAVKFLQYLSNPNGGGKLWVDKSMFLPVIKDVEYPELMKDFATFDGDTPVVYSAYRMLDLDTEADVEYKKLLSQYLENDQTAEEFAEQVQKLYEAGIDDLIALNPVDINSYIDKIK